MNRRGAMRRFTDCINGGGCLSNYSDQHPICKCAHLNLHKMGSPRSRVGCAAVVLLTAVLCVSSASQTPAPKSPEVNADSVVLTDFEKQVKEYVKLHKKAEAGLPPSKPTDSPGKLNERRRLLAARIETARHGIKQGALFSPQVSQLFKRLISMAYQASGPEKVGTSLRHDEPVHDVPMKINGPYPEQVPLQTTPPSILLNLPPLPKELDYRIVGQNLVLRDTGANIIVDYIAGAIPHS